MLPRASLLLLAITSLGGLMGADARGCGGIYIPPIEGTTSGTSGTSTGGTNGGTTGDVHCSGTMGTNGSSGSSGASGSSGSSGSSGNCTSDSDCPAGDGCVFDPIACPDCANTNGDCSCPAESGQCVPTMPTTCTSDSQCTSGQTCQPTPVTCGTGPSQICNIVSQNTCQPPPPPADCGAVNCQGSDVCEHFEGGPAPGTDSYTCVPYPAACETLPASNSDCVGTQICGTGAQTDYSGPVIVVTCIVP